METEVPENTETPENEPDDSEALAALQAGFDGQPTETPAAEKTEPKQPPATPAAPEPEFVQITKADWEALSSRASKVDDLRSTLEKSNGTAFGKIGGIERAMNELRAGMSIAGLDLSGISDAEIAEVKDELPALANALTKLKAAGPRAVDADALGKVVAARLEEAMPQLEEKVERKFELRRLTKAHPDWQNVVASEAYSKWMAAQPQDYQDLVMNSWDADVTAPALAKFKEDTAPKKSAAGTSPSPKATARRERLEAAVQPRGSTVLAKPEKSAEDQFNEGFSSTKG